MRRAAHAATAATTAGDVGVGGAGLLRPPRMAGAGPALRGARATRVVGAAARTRGGSGRCGRAALGGGGGGDGGGGGGGRGGGLVLESRYRFSCLLKRAAGVCRPLALAASRWLRRSRARHEWKPLRPVSRARMSACTRNFWGGGWGELASAITIATRWGKDLVVE